MMTNEEILELVRFHFEEGGIRDDGSCSEYFGTPKDFIEFAQAIRRDALYEAIHKRFLLLHQSSFSNHDKVIHRNIPLTFSKNALIGKIRN